MKGNLAMGPIEPIQYAQICAMAVLAERERIIGILTSGDYGMTHFGSTWMTDQEIRTAIEPK